MLEKETNKVPEELKKKPLKKILGVETALLTSTKCRSLRRKDLYIQLHKIFKKSVWQNPASQKITGKNIWVHFTVRKVVILV